MIKNTLARAGLLAGIFSISMTTAQAQDLTEQLSVCAGINNPLERLVCFDNVVAGEGVAATNSASTRNAMANERQVAPAAKGFGSELIQDTTNSDADSVTIQIESYSKNRLGRLVIVTTDGQVWEQISAESYPMDANATYFIERGALNSYYLGRTDINRRTNVRRTK